MKHTIVVAGCLCAIAAGFALAWWQCDYTQVARAGALVVGFVVLSEGWIIITTPNPGNLPMWTNPAAHTAARLAIALICVGTLIQGYGDLVAEIVLPCH